jgi:hypothetical protein
MSENLIVQIVMIGDPKPAKEEPKRYGYGEYCGAIYSLHVMSGGFDDDHAYGYQTTGWTQPRDWADSAIAHIFCGWR